MSVAGGTSGYILAWNFLVIFINVNVFGSMYRVFIKNCIFPDHCNPPPTCKRATYPRKRSECTVTLTTNRNPVLAKERSPNIEHSCKKQYI